MDLMKREIFANNRYKKIISQEGYTLDTKLEYELEIIRNFTEDVNNVQITDIQIESLKKQYELFKIKILTTMKKYS